MMSERKHEIDGVIQYLDMGSPLSGGVPKHTVIRDCLDCGCIVIGAEEWLWLMKIEKCIL